jgi:hypothetical protein
MVESIISIVIGTSVLSAAYTYYQIKYRKLIKEATALN